MRRCNQHGIHWCLLYIDLHLNSFGWKLISVALEGAAVAMVTIYRPTSDHDVTHRLNERALAVHTLLGRARAPHWLLCKTDTFYHSITLLITSCQSHHINNATENRVSILTSFFFWRKKWTWRWLQLWRSQVSDFDMNSFTGCFLGWKNICEL